MVMTQAFVMEYNYAWMLGDDNGIVVLIIADTRRVFLH